MDGLPAHRDVVVIGASAGGVEALRAVVGGLPAELPAAVLVVLHIPRGAESALAKILARGCALPVRNAIDGEQLRQGRVYVAPADYHLLVIDNRIRLSSGPTENGHRPAVDPLFRSAARAYGPRAVGVVLSGSRDDGAAGLAAIVQRGGLAVVQDPAEAIYPSMPTAALNAVDVDYVRPAVKIGPLLDEIARSETTMDDLPGDDPALTAEVAIAGNAAITTDEGLGVPAGFGCPACGGALFEVDSDDGMKRFRCRVGHAWSPESLLEEQVNALEGALWMALRALEEQTALNELLADRSLERGSRGSEQRFRERSNEAGKAAGMIRELIECLGER
jgi:two-component system chemotaxis response regulator CheB